MAVAPVPQGAIDLVARMGTYTLNINPRQILANNLGMDGYFGGGNLWPGDSAADLDDVLAHLAFYPRATIELLGRYGDQWIPASPSDVARLRAAFFALYGLGKPDAYPPPLQPPGPDQ